MDKRELIARQIEQLSDEDLDRLLEFLGALTMPCALLAEPALARDWLSPEEDEAWASL
jgi:hypothetical protein